MLKSQYLTEGTHFKAAVATGGAVTALVEHFCADQAILCAVLSDLTLIWFLIGMMVLDMVTGTLASRSEGSRVNSRRLGEGLSRKLTMLATIAGAVIIGGTLAKHGLPVQSVLYRWIASWWIAVEGLSLYENAARTGLPMPTGLKTVMERLLQKADASVAEAVLPDTKGKE